MPLKFNPEKMTGIITCFFLSGLILFNPNPTWGQEKPVGRIIGIIGTVELLIG